MVYCDHLTYFNGIEKMNKEKFSKEYWPSQFASSSLKPFLYLKGTIPELI